jgi:hypothetical protein
MYGHVSFKNCSLHLCGSLHFRYYESRVLLLLPRTAVIAGCYTELALLAPQLRAEFRQIFIITDTTVQYENRHKNFRGRGDRFSISGYLCLIIVITIM